MSEHKNLIAGQAVAKLQQLVRNSSTCMFATKLGEVPFHVIPMRVQEADYEGNLWFFSAADSEHNTQIKSDPRVQLIFTNSKDKEFMTIFGTAVITKDRAQIHRLWDVLVGTWLKGGKDDPNVTLICVRPQVAHYWDTEDGKILTTAKLLTKAATGADINTNVQGDLQIQSDD